MPNQVSQRPGSSQLALGMESPNRRAIALAVCHQRLVIDLHRGLRSTQPDLSCPVLLNAEDVANDSVPITAAPPGTLSHLGRHAPSHLVEVRPACLHHGQLTF